MQLNRWNFNRVVHNIARWVRRPMDVFAVSFDLQDFGVRFRARGRNRQAPGLRCSLAPPPHSSERFARGSETSLHFPHRPQTLITDSTSPTACTTSPPRPLGSDGEPSGLGKSGSIPSPPLVPGSGLLDRGFDSGSDGVRRLRRRPGLLRAVARQLAGGILLRVVR